MSSSQRVSGCDPAVSSSLHQVVLDLEDVAEEKELEDLEDGRCGGDQEEEESEDEEADMPTSLPQPQPPIAPHSSHR